MKDEEEDYGYDDYGNICGVKNEKLDSVDAPLSGQDMTNKS